MKGFETQIEKLKPEIIEDLKVNVSNINKIQQITLDTLNTQNGMFLRFITGRIEDSAEKGYNFVKINCDTSYKVNIKNVIICLKQKKYKVSGPSFFNNTLTITW